ncbi:MAG: [NiFe]-hydrogenase assembly chaperone HybE [Alphaproteobacteria bacterium]|nr:[NiFe]-hydrogenase assembly chaperone HybE [Rhodospirillales bacterium]MCW9045012.1 [NiFe]-hydrogenase assembly chaperone HybE [Alphaproteobacteria bacterium]
MKNPQDLAVEVKEIFTKINDESMAGLPIVNSKINVETVGFQEHEGRTIGIVLTSWMMSLVVFSGKDDDWSDVKIGDKKSFSFPARNYEFLANEIEGIGIYYSFALYSPMHEFEYHDHAVAGAVAFHEILMVENENAENELDEERFAMFLAGEEMETIKQKECAAKNPVVDGEVTLKEVKNEPINRRELLRGQFQGGSTPA